MAVFNVMFIPSVLNDDYDLFDDVFNNNFWPFRNNNLMKTDVEEKDGKYIMKTEFPGFNKEDIKMSLKAGTLRIAASHSENNDEKDQKGKAIREERYAGLMERFFYVGKNVKESDIRASYKNGILAVEVPDQKEIENKPEETKYNDIQ